MVRLVNKLTGSDMWVADDRLNEYLGAGHKPVPVPETAKPTEQKEPEEPKEIRKPEIRKTEIRKPVKSGRKK